MRRWGTVLSLALLFPIDQISAQEQSAGRTSSCLPTWVTATSTLATLRRYVTSTDSFDVRLRKVLGLSNLRPNQISYVSDPAVCSSAVQALNRRFATGRKTRRVHVWRIGTRYMVEDPADALSMGYRTISIFDSAWVYRGGYAPN